MFFISAGNGQAQTTKKVRKVGKVANTTDQSKIGGPYRPYTDWVKIISGKATRNNGSYQIELFESDIKLAYDDYVKDARMSKSQVRIQSKSAFEREMRSTIQDTLKKVLSNDIYDTGDSNGASKIGIVITLRFKRVIVEIRIDFSP